MPVYMVRRKGSDFVKIGWAVNVATRIYQMQTGSPEELVVIRLLHGTKADEIIIQNRFIQHHVRAEWFLFCDEMMGDCGLLDLDIPLIPFDPKRGPRPYTDLQRSRSSAALKAAWADPDWRMARTESVLSGRAWRAAERQKEAPTP